MRIKCFFVFTLIAQLCYPESLPRIDIEFNQLSTETFFPASFQLVQGTDTFRSPITIRHRGATAAGFDKRSYAIKLCDENGDKSVQTLLGMRTSHYWILDAMAVDKARMRNRVSMDLWLNFSHQPWYSDQESGIINGYQGKMVEVYVNQTAQGIYCLMERVDSKQLKIQKYSPKKGVRGVLYKNVQRTPLSFYNPEYAVPDNTDLASDWSGFEQKEPDAEDHEPIAWNPLIRHISALGSRDDLTHYTDSVEKHLDIPVFVDYVLFTEILSSRDNVGKNLYISFYHSDSLKALYTPWDLDDSWGRQWNGDIETPKAGTHWTEHQLFINMRQQYHLDSLLQNRYAELRERFFTVEYIDSLCGNYFDLFARTGMDSIEAQIWSGHNEIEIDIPSEREYIHQWTTERLAHLDKKYRYKPSEIEYIQSKDEKPLPKKIIKNNTLYIQKGEYLYDLKGRRIES